MSGTLVLARADVRRLLDVDACIAAVERAFALHAAGATLAPGVLGTHVDGGGFHVKTAGLMDGRRYYAAKVNANFPDNPGLRRLPTIQGIVALYDATDGTPLALLDSGEITSLRTAAATAVAARHLARADARVVTVIGCGVQGRAQLRAIRRVRGIERAYACDQDPAIAQAFARELSRELDLPVETVADPRSALQRSDIVITCTTARRPVVMRADVPDGMFVAAVGADSEDKQELEPGLLAQGTVVVDVLEQCAAIGELHHALVAGVMTRADVHADLTGVVSGRRPGRTSAAEITVFNSTGTALEDVAAAALVFERARDAGVGHAVHLGA